MPFLEAQDAQIEMINTFGGYQHKMSINDGEFYDMRNLACDDFPLAASRAKRGLLDFSIPGAEFLGICGQDKLNVVYRQNISDTDYTVAATAGEYQITLRGNGSASSESYLRDFENRLEGCHARVITDDTVSYVDVLTNSAEREQDGKKYIDVMFASHPVPLMNQGTRVKFGFDMSYVEATGNPHQYRFFYYPITDHNGIPYDLAFEEMYFKTGDAEEEVIGVASMGARSQSGTGILIYITLASDPVTPFTEDTKILAEIPPSFFLDDYAQPGGSLHNMVELYPSRAIGIDELAGKSMTVTTDDTVQDLVIESNSSSVADPTSPTGYSSFAVEFSENPLVDFKPTSQFAIVEGKLCIADYDLALQTFTHQTVVGDIMGGEHQIIKMGAYVIIFPEKIKVNTIKIEGGVFSEIQSLEKHFNPVGNAWRMCYSDGDELNIDYASSTPHDNPEHGEVWADTSERPAVVRKYNENLATWAVVAPYIEFFSESEMGIEEYDALEAVFDSTLLDYIDPVENQQYYVVSSAGKYGDNGHLPGKYYFRFPIAFKAATPSPMPSITVQFSTSIPVLDYVFECNNRLWGCRYGEDSKGDFVNEIFASRLGDPGNFHYFANTSIDAYYVSLGDEGAFTGGIAYNSQPVFFRQDKVHRISGSYPANFQLKTTAGYGCQKGSNRSIVSVNNIVYYLSTVGIMAYSGDIPVSMADAFGTEMYHAGVAGTIGNKYYISMHTEDGDPVLFCYDDAKAMWHKEDDLNVKQFLTYDGECYALTDDDKLIATGGVTGAPEPDFEWMMETGELGYASPFRKRVLKVNLRLKMPLGTRARIDIQYDGDGNWINCSDLRPTGKVNSLVIPISPFRCDYFKLRIYGKGEIKLISVTKFYEEGSDEA